MAPKNGIFQFRCLLHYFKRSVCPFFWEEKVFHNVRSFQKKIGNIYIRIGRGIANQNRLVNNQNAQKCDFFSFKEKKQFETVAIKGHRDVKFDGESISDGFEAI